VYGFILFLIWKIGPFFYNEKILPIALQVRFFRSKKFPKIHQEEITALEA
jgi:hypothetical protein